VKRWRHLLLVTAVALSTAACSSHTSTEATPDQHNSPTTSGTPAAFTGIKHTLPTGKALRNDPDLYRTVTLNGCTRDGGGWLATGTAENRTKRAQRYAVLVFFTDAQARTVDWARARVTVVPGEHETWRASRRLQGNDIRCVVRAVASR
jgi:hypothetical protein